MAIGGFMDKVARYGTRIKRGLGSAFTFAQNAKKMGDTFFRQNPTVHGLVKDTYNKFKAAHPKYADAISTVGRVLDTGDASDAIRRGGKKILNLGRTSDHPVANKLRQGADMFERATGRKAGDVFTDAVGKVADRSTRLGANKRQKIMSSHS